MFDSLQKKQLQMFLTSDSIHQFKVLLFCVNSLRFPKKPMPPQLVGSVVLIIYTRVVLQSLTPAHHP